MVVDGAALVNIIKPRMSQTFDEYANTEFIPYIESIRARISINIMCTLGTFGLNMGFI